MSKKILVVDDSKTALMMEREILEKRTTYQCVTASDGQEAVEKAQQERPDLVLMDVVMPRMNGFEACKMMRQQPSTREIPIVLVTTRGEEVLHGSRIPERMQRLHHQAGGWSRTGGPCCRATWASRRSEELLR